MSRSLTGPMTAALAAKQVAPAIFAELDFSGGFARMWSGTGSVVWDGKTWLGVGHLLALGPVEETSAVEATSLSMSLSGVPPSMVALAYGDFSQGRAAKVWLALIDTAAWTVIADPVPIFQGRMDTIGDSDDGQEATITVSAETNLADLKRLRARFFTNQDQQRLFPGDQSLRFIPSLQDRSITWGVRDAAPPLTGVA